MSSKHTWAAWRPLFVTGTARSGSTLLAHMLSAHRDVTVASDPYLPVFRSLRNAIVSYAADTNLTEAFDPTSPLQDYYFSSERLRMMDVIQAADLQVPFDNAEWDTLLEACQARASAECPDLVPELPTLLGSTYKEICDRGLGIIAKARHARHGKWVGFKEVWTIEFFAPLARTYPDARFIVIMRDPRAMLASMQALATQDPSQAAHSLSYARHWRKYIAFIQHYRATPLFAKRLHVIQFEQLIREPETTAQALCAFLDVKFDPRMLEAQNYRDFSTGATWKGNSSFETTLSTIRVHQAERWRQRLHPHDRNMVDFICGSDMQLAGYAPLTDTDGTGPDIDVLRHIMQSRHAYCNWRSDIGDPQQDYGFELFRRSLLTLNDHSLGQECEIVRRSFLFEEIFTQLRKQSVEVGCANHTDEGNGHEPR